MGASIKVSYCYVRVTVLVDVVAATRHDVFGTHVRDWHATIAIVAVCVSELIFAC